MIHPFKISHRATVINPHRTLFFIFIIKQQGCCCIKGQMDFSGNVNLVCGGTGPVLG